MAEGARYSIGPLTTWADEGDLRQWLRNAAPGNRCTYAIGPALSADHPVKRLAAEAADRGEAHLFQKREGKGWRYGIEKRAAGACEKAKADLGAAASPLDPRDYELLELLGELAAGVTLPSNDDIAERLGLPDRHAARYRIGKLERAGLITVIRIGTMPGGGTAREITITSTGARLRSAVAGEV